MLTKQCTICKIEKNISEFHRSKRGKLGRHSWCKICAISRRAEYYKENAEHEKKHDREKRKEKKAYVDAFLLKHPCIRCGESEPCALDFHHVDPSQKELAIALTLRNGWAIKRIQSEIDKCAVLCANCHRKFHAGIITLAL